MASPYQKYVWCMQWYNEVSPHQQEKPFVMAIRNSAKDVIALFPLALRRCQNHTVAYFIGKSHSNFNMGVFSQEGLALFANPETARAMFSASAARAGIDAFLFANQPLSWNNRPNPLVALGGHQSPSSAYSAHLPETGALFFEQQFASRSSRKRFRYKERQLIETGKYCFAKAETLAEKDLFFQAFLQHKLSWFKAKGIENPFAEPGVQRFFEELLKSADSCVEFYALRNDTHIAALFCTIVHDGRMSGLFTSIDNEHGARRYSPGEVLLFYIMRSCCDRGLRMFDLGIGEAFYKESCCPIEEKLHDYALPFGFKGQCIAQLWTHKQRLKGWVKKNALLFGVAQRSMAALNSFRKKQP